LLAFAALWVVVGCGSAPKPSPPAPSASKTRGTSRVSWDAAGLRVALSREAKSVCVLEQGCPEGPKGAIRIRPLAEPIRDAIADALLTLGFELVATEAERDIVADVEWRGTDTIAVRLQDANGRFIEQASFRRSLARCRELPELSWDSCWAANFEPMKAALTQPLEQSAALLAFARRTKGIGAPGNSEISSTSEAPRQSARTSDDGLTTAGLDASQLERTVARYRRDIERDCWSPAREARDPSAPRTARVSTVVSISADGSVDDVTSASDPPGYLHLSPCIVSQVRRWQFPAAARPTRVSIPFVFAGD
jgi:hypothetical protein